MNISEIRQLYSACTRSQAVNKAIADKSTRNIVLQGLIGSSAPLFFSSLFNDETGYFLIILPDADEAAYFYHDLTQIMGQDDVLFFPSSYRRAVKYGQLDSANIILRTEVLTRLDSNIPAIIVSYPEAVAELVVSRKTLDERKIELAVGQTTQISRLSKELKQYGFQETDYVYLPGQFAVRGSILDIYSFNSELPYRIDFFGDEIDTIRSFDIETQLSIERRDNITVVPEFTSSQEEKIPFLAFMPQTSTIAYRDVKHITDRISFVYDEGFSLQAITEQTEGKTEPEQKEILEQMRKECVLTAPSVFKNLLVSFRTIMFPINRNAESSIDESTATIRFDISPQPLFHKNFDLLSQTLEDYILKGYTIYILADSSKQTQRLRDIFDSRGNATGYDERYGRAIDNPDKVQVPFIPVDKTLHEGFADNVMKVCFFTDHQIFDRFHKYSLRSDKARAGKVALSMKELLEMEPGDFIVHVDFGIGKFAGLVRVPSGDSYQEMIRIVYQRGDIIDLSIHSLHKISKYRRAEGGTPPRLSTLGTGAWERMKERTKKRIKDIARDLIKLYAKRRHEKGYAFSHDTYLQQELEASFLYEDTPDQQKATAEVKADMESPRPMDRLVCGDVGFGKTEVAIRAAFKAACDSKQVAVLVPTTVLAFQHYQTFHNRLRNLPVRVDYLSRARTSKQVKQVIDDLQAGRIDILVGTHKLISKNVKWKDLGLLIIDEEQKFGVSTKERLRTLRTNIDTLTMSATPIPRTLQFSLMGARDMSIMRTPPPNRYPIHTIIDTFRHEIIAEAISFEMSRNGQVFFVNDRINNLLSIANLITRYVPDARVAIGHGQMKPDELENVIMGFINHDYDVLLSTTIVENGIDIPNANTIIINDAHKFGLSDLHQMRGRVGRSNKKAFCYLLSPPLSFLNTEARRRLEALETFSELGSGFNLAMQDLDIRGAGNLLGAEQSGFMEDLGYETYQKILNQAVTELRNEEFSDLYAESIHEGDIVNGDVFVEDCTIESDLEMYFPETYIPGSSERMLLYRELDNIESDEELDAYRKRLEDRFGKVPREGIQLMQVVGLRRLGKQLGCEKIILRQGRMQMQFVSNPKSAYYQSQVFGWILDYITSNPRQCTLKEIKGKRCMVISNIRDVGSAVYTLRKISGSDK